MWELRLRATQPRLGQRPALSGSHAHFIARGFAQPWSVPNCVVMGSQSWFLGGRASAQQQVFSKHRLCASGKCFTKLELVKMSRRGSSARDVGPHAATVPKAIRGGGGAEASSGVGEGQCVCCLKDFSLAGVPPRVT